MMEKTNRVFEVTCCNPKCPQKVFFVTRKIVSPGEEGESDMVLDCPYCQTKNLVNLPNEVIEGAIITRLIGKFNPDELVE